MAEDKPNYKEIELRSVEVQEVMSRMPPWILRSGLTMMFCVVIVLLIGSFLFKYPDVVQAEVVITTLDPPASILARSTGKLDAIQVTNNQQVHTGELLAVIQNPARTEDVIALSSWLSRWEENGCHEDSIRIPFEPGTLNLGVLQPAYANLLNSLNDYDNYRKTNYYPQKIVAQERQLAGQKQYHAGMLEQAPVVKQQYQTSASIFRRDSTLFSRGLLSNDDYDIARRNYLQAEQTFMAFGTTITQTELQLIQSETSLLDLRQQSSELESRYRLALIGAMEALAAQTKAWERDYLLISPVDGKVSFMGIWSSNQNVQVGEVVFTVVPGGGSIPTGKAMLPVQGAGKVRENQRVHARLNNFPDQEFGFITGRVANISNIPTDQGYYIVEIDFPHGMKTNYDIELPISRQMQGTAEIITEDLRLIERFFMPIKKILKEQSSSYSNINN